MYSFDLFEREYFINSDLKNSISQPVKDLIKDSLAQFSMYEMWTYNKRYDINFNVPLDYEIKKGHNWLDLKRI